MQGVDNATNYLSLTLAQRDARKLARNGNMGERVFFHVKYHPQTVPSKVTQQLWRNSISSPPGKDWSVFYQYVVNRIGRKLGKDFGMYLYNIYVE